MIVTYGFLFVLYKRWFLILAGIICGQEIYEVKALILGLLNTFKIYIQNPSVDLGLYEILN